MDLICRVYWGTHGCDLPRGHEGPHYCGDAAGPCSGLNRDGTVRYWDDATFEWSETGKVIQGIFGDDWSGLPEECHFDEAREDGRYRCFYYNGPGKPCDHCEYGS